MMSFSIAHHPSLEATFKRDLSVSDTYRSMISAGEFTCRAAVQERVLK